MRVVQPHDPVLTYAAVLDALPIVAFMAAPSGEITYLSHAWERFTGISSCEIFEQGYASFLHPDDRAHVVARWEAACASGHAYRDECRLRFGDGTYRCVLSQAEPVRGFGDAIVGWVGTVTDIDELRVAEDGLAAALVAASASARAADDRAHFVERLLAASDDCVKVLDLEARLDFMSENGQRALAVADFRAIQGTDWRSFWAGEDRVAADNALAAARAGGRGRFTGMYAVEGRERWWDVSVTAILGDDGLPERLLAVSRDITENVRAHRALARSEERYRVLGEALPGVTWTATPDGLLDYISGGPRSNRLPPEERLGDGWLSIVHPDDVAGARARWQSAVSSGAPYTSRFRVFMPDGTYRWQLVRALPQRDESGAMLRWVGVNVDIDDERRADEAREQFVRLVEASDDFIAIADVTGKSNYVNEAGRRLVALGSMDDARGTDILTYFVANDRPFVEKHILAAVTREGRWVGDYRLRNFETGATVPVWLTAFSLFDETGKLAGIATVGRDQRERMRVEAGMRALAEAGAAMYGSLDFAGTLANVARAVSRSFASGCIVEAIDDPHQRRNVAVAHRDAALVATLEHAAAARDVWSPAHPVARAIAYGDSTLVPTMPAREIEEFGPLDARSMLVVPIRSAQNGSIVGGLTCLLDGDDPRGGYTAEDVRFAQEVAVRAGIALDHARAYERERRIAVTLQEASLPGALPTVPGVTLSADYRPGNSEATIGGDWYDAFLLDDGRVVITIGDVLGKGLDAAVTMGKLRQAMQSVALVLPDPNVMLDAADRTVRAQSTDTYATALAGIFDPHRATFTFASAGHPGPVRHAANGSIEEFDAPSLLLGLRPRGERQTREIRLDAGATLVFFTDGLIETTHDIDDGHRRLHAAMAAPSVTAAPNPARALVDHVLGGRSATDDIAVLVVRLYAV